MTQFDPKDSDNVFLYSVWCKTRMSLEAMPLRDCTSNRDALRIAKLLTSICDGETYHRDSPVYGLHCEGFSAVLGILPEEVAEKGRDTIQIGIRMHYANRVLQVAGLHGIVSSRNPPLRPMIICPPHPLFGILGSGEGCRSRLAAIYQADALLRMDHVVLHVRTEDKWSTKKDPATIVTRARIDELLQEDDEL